MGIVHSPTDRQVNRRIVGFHRDDEGHWVADLDCGHGQHVRHDPPWQYREWVTTAEGRARFLDTAMNCVRCDRSVTAPEGDP
jgi:hypothetical protein